MSSLPVLHRVRGLTVDDLSLTQAEYDLLLHGHPWIRSVDDYASLSRGWAGIFVELLDMLDIVMEEIAEGRPGVHVVGWTTKSKFGSLRVSFGLAGVSGPTDGVWPLLRAPVDDAEARSARICERCGAPGRSRDVDDWLVTLCDAHAAEEV